MISFDDLAAISNGCRDGIKSWLQSQTSSTDTPAVSRHQVIETLDEFGRTVYVEKKIDFWGSLSWDLVEQQYDKTSGEKDDYFDYSDHFHNFSEESMILDRLADLISISASYNNSKNSSNNSQHWSHRFVNNSGLACIDTFGKESFETIHAASLVLLSDVRAELRSMSEILSKLKALRWVH